MRFSAYRLDGKQPECSLRYDAEVINCNCCDYFTFDQGGDLILIEDTRLMATIRAKRCEFDFLKNAPRILRDSYVEQNIVLENVVKVYGSLFVLFKFLNKFLISSPTEICPNIHSIKFWLVANDFVPDEAMAWDHYHLKIQNGLYGRLGHSFIKCVEVIPKDKLSEKLRHLGFDPQDPESPTF